MISATLLTLNRVVLDDVPRDYESGVRGYAAWQHQHTGRGRERTLTSQEWDDAVEDRVATLGNWLSDVEMTELLVDAKLPSLVPAFSSSRTEGKRRTFPDG